MRPHGCGTAGVLRVMLERTPGAIARGGDREGPPTTVGLRGSDDVLGTNLPVVGGSQAQAPHESAAGARSRGPRRVTSTVVRGVIAVLIAVPIVTRLPCQGRRCRQPGGTVQRIGLGGCVWWRPLRCEAPPRPTIGRRSPPVVACALRLGALDHGHRAALPDRGSKQAKTANRQKGGSKCPSSPLGRPVTMLRRWRHGHIAPRPQSHRQIAGMHQTTVALVTSRAAERRPDHNPMHCFEMRGCGPGGILTYVE